MHDAQGMGRAQRIDHAQHQLDRLARRHCAGAAQGLGQGAPRHQFEHQAGLAVDLVSLEHRHDMRMRQAADGTRLVQPLAQWLPRAVTGQQLERDLAVQPLVMGAPDSGLRTPAQFAQQAKAPDALTRAVSRHRPGRRHRQTRAHGAAPSCAGRTAAPDLCGKAGLSGTFAASLLSACSGDTPWAASCTSRKLMPSARP